MPAGRGHLARRPGAARRRDADRQGDRLGVEARRGRAVRRPAREDPRLDGGARAEGRQARHPRRRRRRPRAVHAGARPRDRRGRQGRDRAAVRARRVPLAVRQADARARADVRRGDDAAAGLLRRLLQPDPDGRRVLRLPRADHLGTVRDHGLRGHPRRPDGLLGRRDHARRAPGEVEVDPRDVHAVGGGALRRRRADRPERDPRRPVPADGAEAGGGAPVGSARARPRRRDHAQRPDHGPGLEQRVEDGGRVSRRDQGARGREVRPRVHGADVRELLDVLRDVRDDVDERAARRRLRSTC